MRKVKIALADDHQLFRSGLVSLLKDLPEFEIIYEASTGEDLLEKIAGKLKPDILLLDIKMPKGDGFDVVAKVKADYPFVKIIVLSMFSDETTVMKMVKAGVEGYILKDANQQEFIDGIYTVANEDIYYSKFVNKVIQKSFVKPQNSFAKLNANEITFLKLLCQQLSNKEIADKMFLSVRTIDGYRDQLFEKLEVKSRIGLVLYAIKNKIVEV